MQSIIDKMMQEATEANDTLAARKITEGEWITVRDNRDKSFTWWYDTWNTEKETPMGQAALVRLEITEDTASIFLADLET
jgi:hypothetical protein